MKIQIDGFKGDFELDAFQEMVAKQIRKDTLEEVYGRLDAGVCDICKYRTEYCFKHCDREAQVFKFWLKGKLNAK